VDLSAEEVFMLKKEAEKRYYKKKELGSRQTFSIDRETDIYRNFLGLAGEYCFARFVGAEIEPIFKTFYGRDDCDFVYKGKKIDVKCSKNFFENEDSFILTETSEKKNFKDFYVCVQLPKSEDTGYFFGFITGEKLKKKNRTSIGLRFPAYKIKFKELTPFADFLGDYGHVEEEITHV
jgi:hypothetical protein